MKRAFYFIKERVETMSCTQYGNWSKWIEENCNWKNKSCKHYFGKTNADRIRKMNDIELAEFLTKITNDAQSDSITKCNYTWSEWLQEEVED